MKAEEGGGVGTFFNSVESDNKNLISTTTEHRLPASWCVQVSRVGPLSSALVERALAK